MYAGALTPLLDQDCGQHPTKVEAIEAILCVTGAFSVWDM
jgi:hypothetical protein